MNTFLLLEGGHRTYLAETSVGDTERALAAARTQGLEFVYFQPPNHEDNSIAIDPRKVVGVVADRSRCY